MSTYRYDNYGLEMDFSEDVDEITSLDETERQEIMETFRKSGLHGEDWPKIVFAVLVCTFSEDGKPNRRQAFRSRSSDGAHAEEKIVEFLEPKLMQMRIYNPQVIKLYVSTSPCEQCSDSISALVEEMKRRVPEVKLQISFPALYKIIRPSCLAGNHSVRHTLPDATDHHNNLEGLKHLLYQQVDLQTFEGNHWRDLSLLLCISVFHEHYDGDDCQCLVCHRRPEDEKLKFDFEDLTLGENRRVPREVQNRGRIRTPTHVPFVSGKGVHSRRLRENRTERPNVYASARRTTSGEVSLIALTYSTPAPATARRYENDEGKSCCRCAIL